MKESQVGGDQRQSLGRLRWEPGDFVEFGVRELFRGVLDREVPHAFAVGREMVLEVAEDVPQMVRGLAGVLDLVLTGLVAEILADSMAGRADMRVSFDAGEPARIEMRLSFSVGGAKTGEDVGASRLSFLRVVIRKLLESTGGDVRWTETSLGQETVSMRLPVEVVVERSMLQGLLEGPLEARGVKALVAHADSKRRAAIRLVLEDAGLLVTEADNGYQVLGLLQQAHAQDADFDVLLVAEELPGMGGAAVASAVRSDPDTGLPAVVILRPPGSKGRAEKRNGARIRFIPETVRPARLLLAVQYAVSHGKRSGTAKLHRRSVITSALPLTESRDEGLEGLGQRGPSTSRRLSREGISRQDQAEGRRSERAGRGEGDRFKARKGASSFLEREGTPTSGGVAVSGRGTDGDRGVIAEPLDLSMIQEMTQGDEELVRELASLFVEELAEQRAIMEDGLASDAATKVRRGAHTIKGAAGNFGAARLTKLATELEALAKKGDLAGVRSRLSVLDDAIRETRDWLQRHLGLDDRLSE